MRPFKVSSKAEFNVRAREFFGFAVNQYESSPRQWALANGYSEVNICQWFLGRRELSMETLLEVMAILGVKLEMTPPKELKPMRQRSSRKPRTVL